MILGASCGAGISIAGRPHRGPNTTAGLIWERYIDRLARGLAMVVDVLDPDVFIFVFGGGMSNIPGLCDALPPPAGGQHLLERV